MLYRWAVTQAASALESGEWYYRMSGCLILINRKSFRKSSINRKWAVAENVDA
ncbi:MAG TPA: hypothetical protein H9713_09625 [Candidatus Mediterraneibacter surreyensis]|nr:hypothetical protein [Candidatus Mediterraneibacter surreyensis]